MALLPLTKELHVGIEIECVSALSLTEVQDAIRAMGVTTVLEAGTDGSIECREEDVDGDVEWDEELEDYVSTGNASDVEHGIELRFISPIEDLGDKLHHLEKLLLTMGAGANSTCGLHVHLDARETGDRNRFSQKNIARNLFKYQRELFNAVHSSRRTNEFCVPITSVSKLRDVIDDGDTDHYHGISVDPSDTVEVRMHHGTIDVWGDIYPWTRMLINAGLLGKLTTKDLEFLKMRKEKYGQTNMDGIPNLTFLPKSELYVNSLRPARKSTGR